MFLVTKVAGLLLTPLGLVLLLLLFGLLLQFRWRGFGLTLIASGLIALFIFSLPITAGAMIKGLEQSVPVLPSADTARRTGIGAIVVLGGGRSAALEYGSETVSAATLERLRYAARLHHQTGLPVVATGGAPFGEAVAEAELMRRVLVDDFRVQLVLIETESRNTFENAAFTRTVLEKSGIRRVLLVTHAWHMPRAIWSFKKAALDAVPAPMGFEAGEDALGYVPSVAALSVSSRAVSERVGLLWYRLVYGGDDAKQIGATTP
jgi:uncharacterized SAM-binding protein YcdF (DUF218 family)